MGGWALTFDTTFSFTHICFLITPQLYKFLDTWHMEFFFITTWKRERQRHGRKKGVFLIGTGQQGTKHSAGMKELELV